MFFCVEVALRGLGFAVNRTSYAWLKKKTDNSMLLGGWAGFWQGICETPVYLVKVRAQVAKTKFRVTPNYLSVFSKYW